MVCRQSGASNHWSKPISHSLAWVLLTKGSHILSGSEMIFDRMLCVELLCAYGVKWEGNARKEKCTFMTSAIPFGTKNSPASFGGGGGGGDAGRNCAHQEALVLLTYFCGGRQAQC